MSRSFFGAFAILLILCCYLATHSCKRGPETQDPFSLEVQLNMVESVKDIRWAEHEVVVREVIRTPNNLFLKVEEGKDTYWLATGLGSVKEGNRYFFNEAVVKHDFRSSGLDREFDSIYLVTQLLPESRKDELKRKHFNPHAKSTDSSYTSERGDPDTEQVQKVSLKELLENQEQYENQVVEISGVCTKINAGIMERNWIHLKADREDTEEIVATSSAMAEVGAQITLQAVVRLNKDFGAGYVYPILLEDAILIE